VRFVQFGAGGDGSLTTHELVKRWPKSGVTRSQHKRARAAKAGGPRSTKALEIVALVEALSGDFGTKNGVAMGKGIAQLLAKAHDRRGRTPVWVRELVAYYTGKARES
jgi:hypothetical protein